MCSVRWSLVVPIFCSIWFSGSVQAGLITENFDTDPGWTSYGLPNAGNDYGFSNTSFTGGAPGEAGGAFSRSFSESWYGDTTITFPTSDPISASGVLNVTSVDSSYNSNSLIGHFDRSGFVSGGVHAVGFMLVEDGSSTTGLRVFYRVGNTQGLLFNISDLTSAKNWSYSYDPIGTFTMSISGNGGGTQTVSVSSSQQTSLDTFGLAGIGLSNANGDLNFFIDDLGYTATVPEPTGIGFLLLGLGAILRFRQAGGSRSALT
jgi:hypothetical protein